MTPPSPDWPVSASPCAADVPAGIGRAPESAGEGIEGRRRRESMACSRRRPYHGPSPPPRAAVAARDVPRDVVDASAARCAVACPTLADLLRGRPASPCKATTPGQATPIVRAEGLGKCCVVDGFRA